MGYCNIARACPIYIALSRCEKKIIHARLCLNKMAFTEVSMKLGFCSLFLNEELSSIFGIDLLAATQTNSESGGDVSQIRA